MILSISLVFISVAFDLVATQISIPIGEYYSASVKERRYFTSENVIR